MRSSVAGGSRLKVGTLLVKIAGSSPAMTMKAGW
jgi:hypothetical protein